MSVGEIAGNAPYLREVQTRNISFISRNSKWNSYYVDQSDPGWADYVVNTLARTIVDKGFDGFFLDTVDAVETLMQIDPARSEAHRQGMIKLIKGLKAAYPDKKIILNRGFIVFPEVANDIKGVLVEELFQMDDYSARPADEVDQLLERIAPITAEGLPVYIVDYVPGWNIDLAVRTAERISSLGFHPAVITKSIDGIVLAPPPPPPPLPSSNPRPSPGTLPVVSLQPQAQTAFAGTTITFKALAVGTPTPTYQWQFNGRDILGETSDSLSLQNVRLPDVGEYVVVVANGAGVVRSEPALLTIAPLDVETNHVPAESEKPNNLELPDTPKDSESDGASNLPEDANETDLHNGSSALALAISIHTADGITLSFEASSGISYALQYRDSCEESQPWSTLKEIPADTNSRAVSLIDALTNNVSQRFYRIISPMHP